MNYSLIWLPDVLKAAGLKVVETPGWQTCGHGDFGKPLGVLCHHTCGSNHNIDLDVLEHGRPDLQGPLCNLGLGRDGEWFIVAAGKAWHAGRGFWQNVQDGNAHLIGIEAQNKGTPDDPWPAVQMDSYVRGVAALLKHIGAKSIMAAGHKEYALPHGRKDDPDFNMATFRVKVDAIMNPKAPT